MMQQAHFNHELKQILLAIISDYDLWSLFGDSEPQHNLPHTPHQVVELLLTEGKLLLVVTDNNEDKEARLDGLRQYYKLIAALYNYLVQALYKTFADEKLDFSYYEGHYCLVLVFSGPVPMILEAIGRHIVPWAYQYYQQPNPKPVIMHDMAANVLNIALGNVRDNEMRNGIIKRVLPLRLTDLQPLDLVELDALPIEPPALPHQSENGTGHYEEEETQPSEPPLINYRRSNIGGSKTAPLPGFFAGAGDE